MKSQAGFSGAYSRDAALAERLSSLEVVKVLLKRWEEQSTRMF